jgi:integrase
MNFYMHEFLVPKDLNILNLIRGLDLRHLHATLLMINGENPKVVPERLGHSDVDVTLDLYSHVTSDLQEGPLTGLKICFSRIQQKTL